MSEEKLTITAEELVERRKSTEMPRVTTDHIGIAHYWRRLALLDNDVRLSDDICMLLEALHSPVSTHVLVKRRKPLSRRTYETQSVVGAVAGNGCTRDAGTEDHGESQDSNGGHRHNQEAFSRSDGSLDK